MLIVCPANEQVLSVWRQLLHSGQPLAGCKVLRHFRSLRSVRPAAQGWHGVDVQCEPGISCKHRH